MQNQARGFYAGRSILITGVCGTVGSELLRQLSLLPGAAITGIDNNESELFALAERHSGQPELDFFLGDLRDRETLQFRFRGHDVVFHTAAFKHVGLSERSPRDAVQCNVIGTQNVIEAACSSQVRLVNFTSSDKAVNPTNVMGTSKLLGERLMTAAALHQRGRGPTFFSTRFGNVLGSRGSVIPLFREQIARGGPVTLTDKSMTRFIMTLEQSVGLVLDAAPHAVGGEVFVTKMPVANIFDLAQVMIEELAPAYGHSPEEIEIRTIGPRPGEKMYEELLTEEETRRAIEVGGFIIVNPAGRPPRSELVEGCEGPMVRPYNSGAEVQLSKAELRDFLVGNGLLDLDDSYGRRKCA